MALSSELISQFAKITNDTTEKKQSESTVYGEIVIYNGKTYVKVDGSDLLTPASTTTSVKDNERVMVSIKDHTAIITGNLSDPSASGNTVTKIGNQISEFEIVIADKIGTKEFEAETARIDALVADNATVKEKLTAAEANIETLEAEDVTIKGMLTAAEANITKLETEKLDAVFAEITYATIENLESTNAEIYNLQATYGDFEDLTAKNFEAVEADITRLETEKLSAKEAKITYANIDFTNIGKAAMEYLYTQSGLIENVIVGDGTITGELVGVTIKGDLIEGGTVVADKLVIKGKDGLYYKLNTNGETVETEQTDYNSLNGSIITAKSITANKIAVDDLVAFDATIGGFNITKSSIHSGVKESVGNTTRGIYLDKDGQVNIGDSDNYLMFYKSADDAYKLVICADSVLFGASKNSIETVINDVQTDVNNVSENLNQAVSDVNAEIAANDVQSSSKLEQLRTLLAQVVTDENGHSLMIETEESYVLTTEVLSSVTGVLLEGVTTTTGNEVYLATDTTNAGTYYSMIDSVYYKVTYNPATCTFNISDLENAITAANTGLSTLAGKMDTIDNTVSGIQKAVDDLELIGGYVYVDQEMEIENDDGTTDTVPAIVLGESDSEFKVIITNKQIAFCEGSAVPAYISGQTLIAQNVEVKQKLKQGNFAWATHDGNLGLVWTGPTTASVGYSIGFTDYTVGGTSAEIGSSFDTTVVVRPYNEASMATGSLECHVYYGTIENQGDVYNDCEISSDMVYDTNLGTYVCTFDIHIPLITGDIVIDVIYI